MSESSVYRPTTPHSRHSSEDSAPHQYATRHLTSAAQDAIRLLNMDVHHWLSNAYPAAIQYEHKTYPTAVHLYQALKVGYDWPSFSFPVTEFRQFVRDPDIMRIIRHAESPRKACSLSRTYASWCDPEWRHGRNVKEVRFNGSSFRLLLMISPQMERVLFRKFDQHSDLKRKLLNTGDREIVTVRTDVV